MLGVAACFGGPIHCDVFTPKAGGGWDYYDSLETDAINFTLPWEPLGLTQWRAVFTAQILVPTAGTYGFEYHHAGPVSAGIDYGGSWYTPGYGWDRTPPQEMERSAGWSLSAGTHTFVFDTTNENNPSGWRQGGAVVSWDSGITYVPEPSTLGLLGVGVPGLLVFAWQRRRYGSRSK
jgi:hypothetical protein